MRYVPLNSAELKNKYEVFIDGVLVLTTFDKFSAECERQMAWGKVEIKITKVAK